MLTTVVLLYFFLSGTSAVAIQSEWFLLTTIFDSIIIGSIFSK